MHRKEADSLVGKLMGKYALKYLSQGWNAQICRGHKKKLKIQGGVDGK